jgi:hypothetical protein
MIDAPVIGAAKKFVEKAKLAGMSMDDYWNEYKDVEPE